MEAPIKRNLPEIALASVYTLQHLRCHCVSLDIEWSGIVSKRAALQQKNLPNIAVSGIK